MLKRLAFVLIIVAVLVVILTMTFAQDVPFHVEVLAQTARMRWGPGPTYVVQHYANAGHILLVLEVDADSDPPWTWYYARTPSGAQSWIRSDLVRRREGDVPMEQRVSNPTGNYPVRDDNFCNTNLFRPCQEGADHQLWEAGYWARDRYNHWERGGWDLNVVYYMNPCRSDRVCPRREDWDSGRLEAEMLAVTMTPEATITPFVVTVLAVTGEAPVEWDVFERTDSAERLLNELSTYSHLDGIANLYTPPDAITTGGGSPPTGTYLGRFQFRRETISVTCRFWHRAGVDADDDAIGLSTTTVDLSKLRDDDGSPITTDLPEAAEDPIHASRLYCRGGNVDEADVVARQWVISVRRDYSGHGRISGVSWSLTATIGADNPESCTSGCLHDALPTGVFDYIATSRIDENRQQRVVSLPDGMSGDADADMCTLRRRTSGSSTIYQHACDDSATNVRSTLTFNYTYNSGGGFLQPTPCPDTDNDGEPNCP